MSDAEIKIDDYELTNCIATGNATQIWEVTQAGTNQQFAMKLLLDEAFKIPEEKKILKQEFNLAQTFEHPNIITMFLLQMTKQHGYFIMEHFRAGNLKSMIRHDYAGGQSRCKRLMECLTQALSVVHRKGWIHRDIKPENILISKSGEVRLIDFSLSSKPSNVFARALTKKSNITIQGTRTYLAPELIKREALTVAADIYSLGIVLFETLVGHPPFRHGNPNELLMMHVRDRVPPPSAFDENITPEADEFVLKLLAKKPKDRPATMDEVFAMLSSLTLFKKDPLEYHREKDEADRLSNAQVEEDRLNSRLDAERTASGYVAPPKPKKKAIPIPKDLIKPKKAETPAPPSPAPGMPPQPQMPMHPGMPMPGYPMPGMPMQPGMPMPGYPYPGMPQPGMPMQPGMNYPPQGFPQPGYPQPGYPQPGMPQPGMPAPGQQPVPQQPVPQPPAAAAPQPPTAPPAQTPQQKPTEQKPPEPPEDLPLATLDDLEIEFE